MNVPALSLSEWLKIDSMRFFVLGTSVQVLGIPSKMDIRIPENGRYELSLLTLNSLLFTLSLSTSRWLIAIIHCE